MERITSKDVESVCKRINQVFGRAEIGWDRENGRNVARVGHFYLDGAYDGWALYEIMNEGGGVHDVFSVGHVSRRELYGLMQAFLRGAEYEWADYEGRSKGTV